MEACQERWADLSQEHFGAAKLGDARRTKRLVKSAGLMMRNPSGTLPKKLANWADLNGLYRLVGCEQVTHAAVIEPHICRTREMMRQTQEVVLLVQDATELDYTTRTGLKDLGQIGTGHARGYICQNVLAVTPQRRVLGLAGQILHKRRKVDKKETPLQKREHPDRESRLWLKGCEATGPVPQGCNWVDVCDRGSDTFEFLEYEHGQGRKYVIRSARDRNVDGEDHVGGDRIHQTLHAYARDLATLGTKQVQTQAHSGGRRPAKARMATVRVAAGPVSVAAPHFARGECSATSLDLWVVHVREIDPPAGVEPLEWVLLTNVPTQTFAQACERVNWYECRWVIEMCHPYCLHCHTFDESFWPGLGSGQIGDLRLIVPTLGTRPQTPQPIQLLLVGPYNPSPLPDVQLPGVDPASAHPTVQRRMRKLQRMSQIAEPPLARLETVGNGTGGGAIAAIEDGADHPGIERRTAFGRAPSFGVEQGGDLSRGVLVGLTKLRDPPRETAVSVPSMASARLRAGLAR
jgi:hypothetical protein